MNPLIFMFVSLILFTGCNLDKDTEKEKQKESDSKSSVKESDLGKNGKNESASTQRSSIIECDASHIRLAVADRTHESITLAARTQGCDSEVTSFQVLVNNREFSQMSPGLKTFSGLLPEQHYFVTLKAVLANGTITESSAAVRAMTLAAPNSGGYFVPERKVLGSPTILASQPSLGSTGRVENLRTGEVFNNVQNPLADAIKRAIPGDIIGVSGHLSGIHIGKYSHNSQYAFWQNGAVIRDIGIKSIDPSQPAIINHVKIQGNFREAGQHGVDDITFQDVRFKSSSEHESTPFNIYNTGVHGTVRLYNVSLENNGSSNYGGTGLKWGMRAMGNVQFYDIRGVNCPDRAEEHCLYLDGPGLDGNAADPRTSGGYISDVIQTAPSGRTSIQIVNRGNEDAATPAGGQLVIRNSQLLTRAGSGGSAVTVAGFLGSVYLENLDIDTDLGAIVVYSNPNHGLLLNENGFTTDFVKLKNINIQAPNASRSHIALSGVEEIEVEAPFSIAGAHKAFNFNTQFGGGIDNGSKRFVGFPGLLSEYSGFISHTRIVDSGQVLSSAEINALQE